MHFTYSGKSWRTILLIAVIYGCTLPQKPVSDGQQKTADKYAEHVRSTDFQRPDQQIRGFKLPPGFEITLFASEPQIGKPMNIEFDDRGRLWVTQSAEYPMAADEKAGKDKITILEDTDGDGKADKFTDFKTGLNIPIGIMPVADGAIAYSIPYVYYFKDRDQDGRADESVKLLGPFGYNDTHGMINNFIRGFDGWVHASHGFSNTSRIAGADGDSIVMFSGNTFRFRTDGSRAEQTTYGRVNPFGFSYDERGYLYSVDCHSKPLYQLIPGADYPHFGKKPQGIGFGPEMTRYELGSTALSGLVYYTGANFPDQYRNNFFIGDVVTSRISRNSVRFNGSTPELKFEEDFLLSDDPWFRPVDIKTGPDGAIYVADFYNRIIGHYEVDLRHPGRDRTSGRIWKITYKGGGQNPLAKKDWSKATLEELAANLGMPQLNIRMRLADRIYDSFGEKAVPVLESLADDESKPWQARVQALWLLNRLNASGDPRLERLLSHENENLRIHSLRILAQRKGLPGGFRTRVTALLSDASPFVRRSAAEVLTVFASLENLTPLMKLYETTPETDTHLKYTALLAIRSNLADKAVSREVMRQDWAPGQESLLAKAARDLPDKTLANFVLAYLLKQEAFSPEAESYLGYVSAYISPGQVDALAARATRGVDAANPAYLSRLQAISAGLQQSGRPVTPKVADLAKKAAAKVVADYAARKPGDLHTLPAGEKKMFLAAVELLGQSRAREMEGTLLSVLPLGYPLELQQAAVNALVRFSPTGYTPVFTELFTSPATSDAYREKLVPAIAANPTPDNLQVLRKQLPGSSRNLQTEILTALARVPGGLEVLTEAMEAGEAPVDLLQVGRVKSVLNESSGKEKNSRLEALLAKSEGSVKELEALLKTREAGVGQYKGSAAKGKQVFENNCSACHQIKGAGGMVGPQLDGIGNWGVKALTEKILSPNRNITEAFKTYQINLKSGEQRLGLYRRTEGATMVFADHAGQEFSVATDNISQYSAVNMTIMPDQFRYTIPENDFYELLTYLSGVK